MSDAFLDTNILVRHLLQDHPDHSRRSSLLIDRIASGQVTVAISETVVFETVFVLNLIYEIPRADVAQQIIVLLSLQGIVVATKAELLVTLDYWPQQSPLSFADCYHLVTTKSLGLDAIYTFDRKLGRYPGVKRIEP